jgi:hypothetical protein
MINVSVVDNGMRSIIFPVELTRKMNYHLFGFALSTN